MAVTNDQIIQAVFTATDEAKPRALAILEGNEPAPSSDLSPPSSEAAPLLMGMGDSAKFLGLSRATLWRMIRDGRLIKVEIYHNAFRLRRSDILDLVRGRTAGFQPASPSNQQQSTSNHTPEASHE